ncbi:MAG: pyridoxal-phosphate dependent enzyme, partial [Actinobacteria bacterium]|nr:pyridoxal-phosphate dependent enzyme [Actinomycetota bacterium]
PAKILDGVRRLQVTVPLIVMCYYNTVFRSGHERFAHSVADAGISGVIVPDLPLEEAGDWCAAADAAGVEPAGGAAIGNGIPGVVHGMKSFLMQDEEGQVREAHSISAGLDYPGVGPEHSHLAATGRAEYPNVTDDEVVSAFQLMARSEGIIPALECAHALAWIVRESPAMQGATVLMNLSGRGDKDVAQMMNVLGNHG